jgi:hypothetical protein
MTQQVVTYEDFKSMGLSVSPYWIRKMAREGRFPKPIKGSGIDGTRTSGKGAKFYWRKADVENYIKNKNPRQ